MGTQPYVAALRKAAALLVVLAAAGCTGGSSNVASHTPSPPSVSPSSQATASPSGSSASPQPVTGAYGVLVSSQASSTYTVSIIGVDGKVVASAAASTPVSVSCANSAAALVSNPVSTTNSRVYFMDAQGVVRYLDPAGGSGQATTVPAGTGSRRAMFAVSPDDARIAVIVDDFNSSGASTRLYVENLNGGGNHLDLFSESRAYTLWPVGWHGTNNLVLAKVASCTQGGGPLCCGPLELHVVDPATAVRKATLGASDCIIAGPPSPIGALCESQAIDFKVLDWAGNLRLQEPSGLTQLSPAYVSPGGGHIAVPQGSTTRFAYESRTVQMEACSWIDDTHVLSGGDPQHQPRVGDITSGTIVPVATEGDCAGRIPGGL